MGVFSVKVELSLTALALLRHSLDAWLQQCGMTEPPRAAVVLATHEALANAIQHSKSADPIVVYAEARSNEFVIEVTDRGHWQTAASPPDEQRGRGLPMIRELVSAAQILTDENGTTVRLLQSRM